MMRPERPSWKPSTPLALAIDLIVFVLSNAGVVMSSIPLSSNSSPPPIISQQTLIIDEIHEI